MDRGNTGSGNFDCQRQHRKEYLREIRCGKESMTEDRHSKAQQPLGVEGRIARTKRLRGYTGYRQDRRNENS